MDSGIKDHVEYECKCHRIGFRSVMLFINKSEEEKTHLFIAEGLSKV